MKVVCISKVGIKQNSFVIGGIYDVYCDDGENSQNWEGDYIIGDNGWEIPWNVVEEHFKPISEIRDEQIDKILE